MTERREALVVGINRYPLLKDEKSRKPKHLEKPATDAEAIAQMLEKYGNFRVRRLPENFFQGEYRVDPNPSPQNLVTVPVLEAAIAELFNPPGFSLPNTALLFFAGHGLRKEQGGVTEGFLATSDANPNKGKWGVSLRWLRDLLQKSGVRQQIVCLDCCYSGELLNFDEADPGNLGIARDRCLIAASREFEVAFEELSGNHGVLTGALLPALNPEQDPDGWVTNYSLVDFIKKQLQTSRQRPLFHNIGGEIILTGKKEKIDRAVLMTGVCPYKGLSAFDFNEEDPKYFYGRTALTDQLLEKVREGNFLAVLGASGSGKSSVVRAGLLHQLKLGQRLGGSDQWVIKIFRPGEHPLESLALSFAKDENFNSYLQIRLTNALNAIRQGAEGLKNLVKTTVKDRRLILVVDQFEEAFTLCQDEHERQQFLECLLGALEITDNQLCLILTMRADFFGKCAEQDYAGLASKIQEHLVTVTPMSRQELEQAITEPAKKVGLELERELVAQMLNDIEGPGSLPLLQYTLTELWQQRRVERLKLVDYTRLGGIKGTLQKRADEIFHSLSVEEQRTAKRIFLELTQLGEGTEDTRRQVLKTGLIHSQQSAALTEGVLKKLADARLVVTSELRMRGEGEETVTVVDVAHEALIRHWSLLRQWVNENREAIRRERKIEETAQEWERHGKQKDLAFLLQGAKLVEAETFLQDYSDLYLLSNLAQEFIQASKAESDRRLLEEEEARKQRELVAEQLIRESKAKQKANRTRNRVALVSLVVLTGLSVFSFLQARNAEQQSLISKIQTSEALLVSNNQLEALIQALQAHKLYKEANWQQDTLKYAITGTLQQIVYKGQEQKNLFGHDSGVTSLVFSPDGKTIASASFDNTIKLWSQDGKLLNTFSGHDNWVRSVVFSPDGKTNDVVTYVAFSPDGKTIASASQDRTIKLWNRDNNQSKTFLNHSEPIWSLVFSPDGKMIASASQDRTVKLWNLESKRVQTFSGHSEDVNSVAFSPDGKTIASASDDKTIKLWSREGQLLTTLSGHSDAVWSVAFSPNGKTIASAGADQVIKLWQNSKDEELIAPASHSGQVDSAVFSPDGKTIASASVDKTIKLWNLEGKVLNTLSGHKNIVWNVAFSPDGKTIASASDDKTIKLWNLEGQELKTISGHSGGVTYIAFSPNGKTIASASRDKTIKLWNLEGQELKTISGHSDVVWKVAFSPDGKTIASASRDKTIKLWNLDGLLLKTFSGHKYSVSHVMFSPDGKTIASASHDKTIKLWNREGQLLKTLFGHRNEVNNVVFSPDGKTIASASDDKTIQLWSLDGSKLKTLFGHKDRVLSISFSPDGKMMVSTGGIEDSKVILWNLDLDDLLVQSCNVLRDYLKYPNNGMSPEDERRRLCD
jgi:WD40 repeat protein/energy-coupling factor transporter ATP-binding protein EcfA2